MSPAEFQRAINEVNRKARAAADAINRHNREVVRRHNEEVRKVNDHNNKAHAYNQDLARRQKLAVDNYNLAVRDHNARVRANEQRRINAIRQLNSRPATVVFTPVRQSALMLNEAYARLEQRMAQEGVDVQSRVLSSPSEENANSLEAASALGRDGDPNDSPEADDLEETVITTELSDLSSDLDLRWRGALYALNPRNPDAARHFCTSAREVFIQMLDAHAPDDAVVSATPTCERTRDNKPTRRSKIQFILESRGQGIKELGDFVDADVNDILDLFSVFNSATHGAAGKYGLHQLRALKNRVEGGIVFLANLTRH